MWWSLGRVYVWYHFLPWLNEARVRVGGGSSRDLRGRGEGSPTQPHRSSQEAWTLPEHHAQLLTATSFWAKVVFFLGIWLELWKCRVGMCNFFIFQLLRRVSLLLLLLVVATCYNATLAYLAKMKNYPWFLNNIISRSRFQTIFSTSISSRRDSIFMIWLWHFFHVATIRKSSLRDSIYNRPKTKPFTFSLDQKPKNPGRPRHHCVRPSSANRPTRPKPHDSVS